MHEVKKVIPVVRFDKNNVKKYRGVTKLIKLPVQCGLKSFSTPAVTPNKGQGPDRQLQRTLEGVKELTDEHGNKVNVEWIFVCQQQAEVDANDPVPYTAINEAVMLTAGLKAATDEFNKKRDVLAWSDLQLILKGVKTAKRRPIGKLLP